MHHCFLFQANSPKYRRSNCKMHPNTQFYSLPVNTQNARRHLQKDNNFQHRKEKTQTPALLLFAVENNFNSLSFHRYTTKCDTDVYEPSGEQYETKLQLSLELPANQFGRPHIGLSLLLSLPALFPLLSHTTNTVEVAPHARNEAKDQKRTGN